MSDTVQGPIAASPTSQQLCRVGGATAKEKTEVREAQGLVQGLTAARFSFAIRSLHLEDLSKKPNHTVQT